MEEAVHRMKVEMNFPGVLEQIRESQKTLEQAVQRVKAEVDFTAVINEIRESRTKTVVDTAPVVQEIGRVKKEVAHESRTVMEEAVQRMKVEMNYPGAILHEIQDGNRTVQEAIKSVKK